MAELRKAYGNKLLEISCLKDTKATTTSSSSSSSSSNSANAGTAAASSSSSSNGSPSEPEANATSKTGQALAKWLLWRVADWYLQLPEIKEVGPGVLWRV
jgi:hypothetical protein